jgi:transcriptional regulator with XRE-family HTH domain
VPKEGQKSPLPKGLRRVVAAKLKAIKDLGGLNDAQLGKKIGISRQKVTRLLECKHSANVDTLQAIGDRFGIAYPELLKGEIPAAASLPSDKPDGITERSTKGAETSSSGKSKIHKKM